MTGGTFVPLGREEDAARMVWRGRDHDFSSFREGAVTIEQELLKRDLTVNSMALSLEALLNGGDQADAFTEVIDPAGGLQDQADGLIRVTSESAFAGDPLRLLRVYRFAAVLGFAVERQTADQVARERERIVNVAGERIGSEMKLIMGSGRAHETCRAMAESGLLFTVIPELRAGIGMEQPASHHLDVFGHSLAALCAMEQVQRQPADYFRDAFGSMAEFIELPGRRIQLCWAALLHDLGKPVSLTIDEDRGGKITFYNHDRAGAELVEGLGRRLRWSGEDLRTIAELVRQHMRPFHLGNVQRKGELSLKACLRLIRRLGPLLPGLFLLGMADALAGKGEKRPQEIEREVDALFSRLEQVRHEYVLPVRTGPPLITGRDLIEELGLEPGPLFREILERVEELQMEKQISGREQALAWAQDFVRSRNNGGGSKGK